MRRRSKSYSHRVGLKRPSCARPLQSNHNYYIIYNVQDVHSSSVQCKHFCAVAHVETLTHVWPAAVHLQCTDGGDQHHDVGPQAGGTTFDVEELLHPDVCSKASFSH